LLRRVVWEKFTDVSEVLAASIIRAMTKAANICETSVNFYQTAQHNNPEDSHLKFIFCLLLFSSETFIRLSHRKRYLLFYEGVKVGLSLTQRGNTSRWL
jgi:hypothetical protein